MLNRIENLLTTLLLVCCIPSWAPAQSSQINYGVNYPATDALGRKLPENNQVGGPKKDRFVGLFYWTWHTRQSGPTGLPHDVSKILAAKSEAIDNYEDPIWPTDGHAYYWGEPLFGYYRDTDRWVLMRHAEMLGAAGVDVIIFDCTNGDLTWKESYRKLCEVFTEARSNGIKTPAIAFMLGLFAQPESGKALEKLYKDFYKPGLYKDLWFFWKGKPLIMAYPEVLKDVPGNPAETKLHREMKAFFTFRPGQPAYNVGEAKPGQWGWLQVYPQHGFIKGPDGRYEQMTVGVAQNWSKERGLTAMNAPNSFGRSYTDAHGQINRPGAVNYGYNFQEQWDYALKTDPEFIFITGWNEWIAGRYKMWQQQPNAFPDEFDEEHSRDVEPMKGGHKDDYYYQMVSNIRRYKGVEPEVSASAAQTIKIDGDFKDWNDVRPDFKAFTGNTVPRSSQGWGQLHYENHTGRNDIVEAKVAQDGSSFYFYVKTNEAMTVPDGDSWMRLFIDADRDHATGWEGYDFMINQESPDGKALLARSIKGWKWQPVGMVDYVMKGSEMEIRVPRSDLGDTAKMDFYFKWSDNMQNPGDIMDFWINGDVAPLGRFNFHYREK
jgi:hypothetical protein